MSEQYSTFILENTCPIKDETDKCPDLNSIQLSFIKDEIPVCQNTVDINQSHHIKDSNVINKANTFVLESFDVDAINALEIKTEKDDRYTGTENSILVLEDNFLVKEEIDIKKEILTYLNNDDSYATYHMENITVNNDKSNNIPIACVDIKTENGCKSTSIQNSKLVIEDGYSVKVENNSFPNINLSLLYSINEENASFQNNEGNNPPCYNKGVFNRIEQISPECCEFKENIYEVKTEIDYKINNFETSMIDLKCDQNDVKKHNTIQFKAFTNCDKKQYKCDICHKLFIWKSELRIHIFTHTGKKIHKCNVCQKLFLQIGSLKDHMFTHTGEKPYKCNICQKSFLEKRYLKRHMFTHTGEKPYKCNICQRSFSLKITLKDHMFTHTGKKPHTCNICLKSFSQNGTLIRHMFTHTGKKLHKCHICQKSFSRKDTLKSHMFTHTGKNNNKCDFVKNNSHGMKK